MDSNQQNPADERIAFVAKAAQNRLLNFAQFIDPKYETHWFHELIAEKLEDALEKVRRKEKVRIILTIPPRHGKSRLASNIFPAWALGKYPDIKFIITTYGAELSEKMGLATRDLINDEKYKVVFPNIELRPDVKAKAKWMTNKGGSFLGVGIGTALTGSGGNVIICDDAHKDRAEAESETIRENVWEYYRSTLYSRLEGYGAVIIIMQRWHQDDLVGRLLAEADRLKGTDEPHDEWEVINFPAIAEQDEYDGKGNLLRKQGDALWPTKFPLPVLNNIRATTQVYNWSSQYQQDPILAENQEFKQHYFKYFNEEDLKGKYLRYYTLVDPAISQKKSADNSVVLTVAKEVNGPNFYRVREDAGHYTPQQLVDLIFVHQNEYGGTVHIETIAYQEALKYLVIEEQRKREKYFLVYEVKSRSAKEERIRGLLGLYQAGVIHHRQSDVEYERELLSFPRGRRDDRCTIGTTMVATDKGDVQIKDIKAGDNVLTRHGYRKVLAAQKTGTEKVITRLGVTGTPNHPVWTMRGWVSLCDIKECDIILSCKNILHGKDEHIADTQMQNKQIIGTISKDESKVALPISTEIYGKRIMGLFQKVYKFIIRMEIILIMRLVISNASARLSTTIGIMRNGLKEWLVSNTKILLLSLERSGSIPKMVSNGGKSTHEECQKQQPHILSVLNAKIILWTSNLMSFFSAARAAVVDIIRELKKNKQRLKSSVLESSILKKIIASSTARIAKFKSEMLHGESTMSALSAKRNADTLPDTEHELHRFSVSNAVSVYEVSMQTAKERDSVLTHASTQQPCEDSERVEDVYNLKVEEYNEYFADGMLVHNCDTMSMLLSQAANTGRVKVNQHIPRWKGYGRKA